MPSTTNMTIDQKNKLIAERLKNEIAEIQFQIKSRRNYKKANKNTMPNDATGLLDELAKAIQACQTEDSPSIISNVSEIKSEQQLLKLFELHAHTKALQDSRTQLLFNACNLVSRDANVDSNAIKNPQREIEIKLVNDTLTLAIQAVEHQPLDKLQGQAQSIEKRLNQLIAKDEEDMGGLRILGLVLAGIGAVIAGAAYVAFLTLSLLTMGAALPVAFAVCLPVFFFGLALVGFGACFYQDCVTNADRYDSHEGFFKQVKNFAEKEQKPVEVKTSQTGLFAKPQKLVMIQHPDVVEIEKQLPMQNKNQYTAYSF